MNFMKYKKILKSYLHIRKKRREEAERLRREEEERLKKQMAEKEARREAERLHKVSTSILLKAY